MRIEEYPNVTFDESLREPKLSPSVEDDRIIELVVQDPVRSPSLEANASKLGYPKSEKEAKDHPIEQVIGELNERTLSDEVVGGDDDVMVVLWCAAVRDDSRGGGGDGDARRGGEVVGGVMMAAIAVVGGRNPVTAPKSGGGHWKKRGSEEDDICVCV
ncbi:hypothetical protein Tco_0816833 [Tanacetum coccineum]